MQNDIKPTDTHKTFSVRIPAALHESLKKAAEQDGRSPNSMVTSAVEQYLDRRTKGIEIAQALLNEDEQERVKGIALDRTLKITSERAQEPSPIAQTSAPPPGTTVQLLKFPKDKP